MKLFKGRLKVTCYFLVASMILLSFASSILAAEPQVSGGGRFSLGIKADGTVWGWGRGGALGDGSGSFDELLTPVQTMKNINEVFEGAVFIEAGDIHSVAVMEDGSVYTWGGHGLSRLGQGEHVRSEYPGKVEGLTDIIKVSSRNHSLGLKEDGTVYAWGYGAEGQIGDGEEETRHEPVQVPGLSGVKDIAVGTYHSVALKEDGTVWAWGDNFAETLGTGERGDVNTPTQVQGISGVTQIDAGSRFTIALKEDGTVFGWGHGLWGWLGNDARSQPTRVDEITDVKAISAGNNHCLFLKENGTVWAWGGPNDEGQLGTGTVEEREPWRPDGEVRPPFKVQGLENVISISAGGAYGEVFSLALVKEDDLEIVLKIGEPTAQVGGVTVYGWGENDYGQVGDGTTEVVTTPKEVPIDLSPPVELDVPPFIEEGRTLVPLRFIGEQLGAEFEWDGDERKVTYTRGDDVIKLWIDQFEAEVNGENMTLDVAPKIVDGRTVVPLRFIGEQLGAQFDWDGETRTITITY